MKFDENPKSLESEIGEASQKNREIYIIRKRTLEM